MSGQGSTVVHVESSGGQIVAHMQETVVRTLTPGGFDVVSGSAAPSRTQIIPGIVLQDSRPHSGGSDTADAAPIVRLFVPGTKAARVTLGITTSDGGGSTVNATAEPGVVTDVTLDDFPDGRYSFTVSSTEPVVAGARTTMATEDGRSDLGWFASAEPLGERTVTALASGANQRMSFVNPTRSDATVTFRSGDQTQRVSVVSGGMATVIVPLTTQLRLSGTEGLVAGVTYMAATASRASRCGRRPRLSTPIRVYP